jgi:clan AA aspartic protease
MIIGEVTPDRQAMIRLLLRGPRGDEVEVEAVLDTGFTDFLTLPPTLIAKLQLPFRETSEFTLADGSIVQLDVFRATVLWAGQTRGVLVTAADGGPLVGMSLIYGNRLILDAVDGGQVTIGDLP